MVDKAKLRKLAETVATGWFEPTDPKLSMIQGYKDRDFLCAASPDTVLALLDELDEATNLSAADYEENTSLRTAEAQWEIQRERLEDQLAIARTALDAIRQIQETIAPGQATAELIYARQLDQIEVIAREALKQLG
jgi:hypothetical protein